MTMPLKLRIFVFEPGSNFITWSVGEIDSGAVPAATCFNRSYRRRNTNRGIFVGDPASVAAAEGFTLEFDGRQEFR